MAKRNMSSPEQDDTAQQGNAHGVGALLKASRLRVGDDLRDIADVLRIRFVYLEAIEDGRFGELPGPTYATGFIRAYAEHLGLDSEEVVRRYKADVSGEDGDTDKSKNLVFPEPIPEPGIPGGAVVFVGIVVAVVAYGVWYVNTSKDGFLAELISPMPERLAEAVAKGDSAKAAPEAAPETAQETTPPAEPEAAEKPAEQPAEKPVDTDQAMTGSAPEESQSESQEPTVDEKKPEMAAMTPAPESAPERTPEKTPEPAPAPAPETVTQPAPKPAPEPQGDKPASEPHIDKPAEPTITATPEPAAITPEPVRKRNPLLGLQVAAVPEDRAAPPAPVQAATQPEPHPEPGPASHPEPQPEPQTPSPDIVSAPPSASGSAPAPTPETASLPPPADGGGKVTIRALTNSWIQIRDDIAGELLLTRLLRAGDSYAVPGRKGLKLSTGNAGALEILVDGKAVPAIGADGDVRRNVSLDADKLKAGTAAGQ